MPIPLGLQAEGLEESSPGPAQCRPGKRPPLGSSGRRPGGIQSRTSAAPPWEFLRAPLIPHIALVELNFVALEEAAEFLLKRALLMMLGLVPDIRAHIRDHRLADRKSAI